MGKLLYIRNYSSVSLTAATFPDKGRHTKYNITAYATNQMLFYKRVVVGADPYHGTSFSHTRRGDHWSSVQTVIANCIWCRE